ncbi:MAG: peptide deformylase [Bryobacteraceae bacterium]
MSIRPIVQLEREEFERRDTSLRQTCENVAAFGAELQQTIDDIVATFERYRIAVGLAAPQVGIQLKVAVINLSADKVEPTLILINPQIISASGKKDRKKETCMSLPHYCGEVERREKINISYQNRRGEPETLSARGFLARVIAHEIDHLEGILYIDRMDSLSALEPVDLFRDQGIEKG